MSRARRVTVSMCDEEGREVEVRALYTPGSRDYYSRSYGNWLPGDPCGVEVLSVSAVDEGADVDGVRQRTDEIDEAVILAAMED